MDALLEQSAARMTLMPMQLASVWTHRHLPPTPFHTLHASRSMDVESGPDADTPRPIGVGLLLCMLERGGEDVVQALLSLAQRMQVGGVVCEWGELAQADGQIG